MKGQKYIARRLNLTYGTGDAMADLLRYLIGTREELLRELSSDVSHRPKSERQCYPAPGMTPYKPWLPRRW